MKKWQVLGTTVIGASLLLGACGNSGGGSSDSGDSKDKEVKGEVKGDGSSTVGPIIEILNEKFAQKYPNVTVSSGTSGTGGGFEKFINNETDFSNASRPIKDEEKKKLEEKGIKYSEWKIAKDGVTIAVNKDNDFVKELTVDELKKSTLVKLKLGKMLTLNSQLKKSKHSHQTNHMVLTISSVKKL